MTMDLNTLRQRASQEWDALQNSKRPVIMVGTATCGRAAGSLQVLEALQSETQSRDLDCAFIETGCIGLCYAEPLVCVTKPGQPTIFYSEMTPKRAAQLVEAYLLNDDPLSKDALGTIGEAMIDGIPRLYDTPVLKPQVRRVLRNCGIIDPTSLDHYLARNGYSGVTKAFGMKPDQVVNEVKNAGLRGRGGAGFPTWQKWQFCRDAQGDQKYLICNADEGDPGAFMNRSLIEGDPHALLEGMIIAGYALGASVGYIYCRAEYPLALERLRTALEQAETCGLLGDDILNSGFDFHIKIKEGAGAFVCGEETALIASIEGERGMPRPRPPFPAVSGLWGKPTIINNVETLASVAMILQNGAEWYAQYGTEKSKGTKTFALVGKVKRTGLVEVPLGITLREMIYDIGGGISGDKAFKAVQTGGPSGGCIPAEMLDTPIDYDSLKAAGAIMGSGGIVVMDEDTCMVDVARYFLDFTQKESCGKCGPCRLGTRQMLDILTDITEKRGNPEDVDLLVELGEGVKAGSLCGLGQTVPNPVLTTIRYFRDEYVSHIIDERCPAGVCRVLAPSRCQNACPAGVNVPQYIALIGEKEYQRAADLVRRRNPFASTCGRLCTHPCEAACRRGEVDEPIAIMNLKRVATDFASEPGNAELKESIADTGKKVAVVGGGPAGLSAAYFLALQGHRVIVYEALTEAGGMMFVGAPAYRMPREAVRQDVAYIEQFGVEIVTGVTVGRDIPFRALCDRNHAVFVAVGAHCGLQLGIPGDDAKGVVDGVTFLREMNLGGKQQVGRRIAVIGGGNVAMDAARSALRLGAESVTVLYRRTEKEMPAHSEEIEEAREEGVDFEFLCAPVEVITQGEIAQGLRCIRMRLGEVDASGRRRPLPIDGSDFDFSCDMVIAAIGQKGDLSFVADGIFEITPRGTLGANLRTQMTSEDGVFAGGDCSVGGGTVIEAVAAGQRAAVAIDCYLGGTGALPPNTDALAEMLRLPETGPGEGQRPARPYLPMDRRRTSFDEVQGCYDPDAAVCEARRCLRCDLEL